MTRTDVLILSAVASTVLSASIHAQNSEPLPSLEARRARTIAQMLENGRVGEAMIEAEAASRRLSQSGLIQRRSAQAALCSALSLDEQVEGIARDTGFSRVVTRELAKLRDPAAATESSGEPAKIELMREAYRKAAAALLTRSNTAAVAAFQQRVADEVAESGATLERRSNLMRRCLAGLGDARRLGDAGSELELTELWARAVVVAWQREAERAKKAPRPARGDQFLAAWADNLQKALEPFASSSGEDVLRRAGEVATRRASDAAALAGSADVIAFIAGIESRPDPLRTHLMARLNNRYLKQSTDFNPEISPDALGSAREQYLQARDGKSTDPVATPASAVLRLYLKAWELDKERALPYLPLRLYLLQVAFDRPAAREILELGRRGDANNAVFGIEDARAAMLLDDRPADGLAFCRRASRLKGASRSYLVAVPSVLRRFVSAEPAVREWVKAAWPGYQGLFVTLSEAQAAQKDRASVAEMRLLRLNLAEQLCRAPDYADQALGVHEKSKALSDLAAMGAQLPEDQRALLELIQQQHAREFQSFPSVRNSLILSAEGGIGFLQYPMIGQTPGPGSGITLAILPSGGSSIWNVGP